MGNFRKDQIIGYTYIDGRKVTVLKEGVKKKHNYYSLLEENDMGQMNQDLISLQRHAEYLKKVVGLDDFSEN